MFLLPVGRSVGIIGKQWHRKVYVVPHNRRVKKDKCAKSSFLLVDAGNLFAADGAVLLNCAAL